MTGAEQSLTTNNASLKKEDSLFYRGPETTTLGYGI
jgi:hypothetical protein